MEKISLSKDFIEHEGIKSYEILEKFDSKKNDVYRIRCFFGNNNNYDLVLKKHKGINWKKRLQKEYFILEGLKSSKVLSPKPCFKGKDFIILEFLEGITFLELIERHEEKGKEIPENLIYELCKYIYIFNKESSKLFGKNLILWDVNLKNFIVKEKSIFKVDFEECRNGAMEEDGGRLCAFLLTYKPEFTKWKFNLASRISRTLIEDFKLDGKRLKKEMLEEFKVMGERRNKPLIPKTEKLLVKLKENFMK